MLKIQLASNLILNDITEESISIFLEKREFILSGEKIAKYFIKYFEFYVSPISIESLKELISKREKSDFFEADLIDVLNLLLSKKVLEVINQDSILIEKKFKILIFDFLNQEDTDLLKVQLERLFLSQTLKVEVTIRSIDLKYILRKKDVEKFDMVVIMFWFWYSIYLSFIDQLSCIQEKDIVILPFIFNNNYFSIGPQIFSESSKCISLNSLRVEKARYSYKSVNENYDSFIIAKAHLVSEISKILIDKKSQTVSQMITYNYNSSKLDIRKIRYIETEISSV